MQDVDIPKRRTHHPRTSSSQFMTSASWKETRPSRPFTELKPQVKICVNNRVVNSPNTSVYEEEISEILQHQNRLSLAYGVMEEVPCLILKYIADKIQILDLSHNRFRNLSFLQHFPNLQTLILDKNSNLDCQSLPAMESLEILWLNNCNLINITDWLTILQSHCPGLKQLSMMCNPVGWTVLNGVSEHDEREYLTQILKILPSLEYFDGIRINDEHRRLAAAAGRRKVSFALLEELFRKKLMNFINFSTNLHKNYMSVEKLNAHFIKNKRIIAKNTGA